MCHFKTDQTGSFFLHQFVCFIAAPFLLAACASTDSSNRELRSQAVENGSVEVPVDHRSSIEAYSAGDTEYSGFYNNFEYKATLLNSAIRAALLDRQISIYQWDREKSQTAREKSNQEMSSETTVFISFFTPERRNDNLTDDKSIWKVYLEAGSRRYEGKPKKVRTLLAELQALYPYHSRWNTPYLVIFPVPTTAIESQDSSITVTGPLGSRTVQFKALR
jgi:hypothetical protein